MSQPEPMKVREDFAGGDIRDAVKEYRAYHDDGGGNVDDRKNEYTRMVRGYYDLVTDFYERGWGKSFHFAPRYGNEPFLASIQRHQHYLALRLGLEPGKRAMDVGCGVGGPMREIARFSGAQVVGVNNNSYQVGKGRGYNEDEGLSDLCSFLESDFMQIEQPDASFDAIYGIEATCHAPDKCALFKELHRLLKPGGRIAVYEWCLTEDYRSENPEHLAAKRGIEEGNGLPDIATIEETRAAFADAGFTLLDAHDKATEGDAELPWHHSLAGRDFSTVGLRRSAVGKRALGGLIKGLEWAKIAPSGTNDVKDFLSKGADALVTAADLGIFTPMAFFLAEKPHS